MKTIEYYPFFLKDIREFKIISNIEDEELEKVRNQIEKLIQESVVSTAESYGLERYEKIYNIENISNDTNVRRFNIISKINNRAPFTLKWLNSKLKQLVGEGNYTINVDYDNYKIVISIVYLFGDITNALRKDLIQQLPANLIIQVNLSSRCNMFIGSIIHEKEHIRLEVLR